MLPKQGVAGSNPVTRSICYNRGACLIDMAMEQLIKKYRLYAEAQGLSQKTIDHVVRCVRFFDTFMGGVKDVSKVTPDDLREFIVSPRGPAPYSCTTY